MDRQELAVYSAVSNLAVIEVPGRRFPGSVIQGDSLIHLCTLASSIHQRAVQATDQNLIDETAELEDLLQKRLRHYEETLRQHGIDLPYPPTSKK
jgi:hypothetical protein